LGLTTLSKSSNDSFTVQGWKLEDVKGREILSDLEIQILKKQLFMMKIDVVKIQERLHKQKSNLECLCLTAFTVFTVFIILMFYLKK